MGQNNFASLPVLFYGIVALMAGTAYYILSFQLIKTHGKDSTLAKALVLVSVFLYTILEMIYGQNIFVGMKTSH